MGFKPFYFLFKQFYLRWGFHWMEVCWIYYDGTRFEIRDANGKVVATVPTRIKNVAFDFFQKLKQSGVRVGVNEFVVIKPGALCVIDTPEGKGTGFFSGNDIVTAAHVVGNNTFVSVCYGGLVYEAKVRYMPFSGMYQIGRAHV